MTCSSRADERAVQTLRHRLEAVRRRRRAARQRGHEFIVKRLNACLVSRRENPDGG